MIMGIRCKVTRCLRSATSDKEALNRLLLRWHRCFKEVEKELNRGRKGE